VSWQAAALVLLAVTLLGGAVWYERSRPPSQIVALVAALAALAVAGRIALSPIPNVVPTTDIVLFAGYALGGAPGFAVGALAGLVSNFWLGQGPWTPWQMAGWGMTGVLGAGLAAAGGRSEGARQRNPGSEGARQRNPIHVGRVGLAVVCAAVGFAYGALLDFSLMVTYGGEQSLDRFLALSARGLPFNIAHAAGNAALALVAGPAIVRMLIRYRRRFEFVWARGPTRVRGAPAAGAACLLCALLIAPLLAGPPRAESASGSGPTVASGSPSTVGWLRAAQNPDGGFGIGPGAPSSPVMTGWACLGLEAKGWNPLDLRRGGNSPISYLRRTAGEIRSVGDIERTTLVLAGAGLDPRKFGRDLVTRLRRHRLGDGSWPGQVNPTAFGILALKAAGSAKGVSRSAAWLRSAQNDDGGWGFARGSASDPDSTGAALQALAAAGGSGEAIAAGVAWLRRSQSAGGGFAVTGGSPNAQSTAWAVQGLIAGGVSPATVRSGGRSPLDYLASVRAPDGHYRYSAASDQTPVWVTGQVLAAVSGEAFPLAAVARRRTTGKSAGAGAEGGAAGAGAVAGAGAASGEDTGPGAAGKAAGSAAKSGAKPAKANGNKAAADPAPEGEPQSATAALDTASSGESDSGDSDALTYLLVGAGMIVAGGGLWGGWRLYRRRPPV
jgi:energy-coupling factor transport system substrate-specific component